MTGRVSERVLGLTPKQWFIKTLGFIIGLSVVWFGTQNAGFPVIFSKLFSIYVVACYIFYIIIDLPPMKPLSGGRALLYFIITFFGFSGIFAGSAMLLPQFETQFEIAKINKPPLVLAELAGPEVIAAGREVFETNKCFNCHKADGTGSSMRGPNFDLVQVGLKTREELTEDIMDPRKNVAIGFEDKKSKKAMPTYYSEEISKDELNALLAFLQTLWNKEKMPMEGKEDVKMLPWDEDPGILAIAKETFEGAVYEDLNCAACHGKDGMPLMEGARDLRNPNSVSKRRVGSKLSEWSDADWFDSVSNGIEDTPMMAWMEEYPPKAIWLAIAYAKHFSKGK